MKTSAELLLTIERLKQDMVTYEKIRMNKLDERKAELAVLLISGNLYTSVKYKRSEIYKFQLRTNEKMLEFRNKIVQLEKEFDILVIEETDTEEICTTCFCAVGDCQCSATDDEYFEVEYTSADTETLVVCEATDEKGIEEFLRKTTNRWIGRVCSFAKATGRTWKQLAENFGDMIVVRERPSVPRCYLHTLVRFDGITVFDQLRAKIALEVCKK